MANNYPPGGIPAFDSDKYPGYVLDHQLNQMGTRADDALAKAQSIIGQLKNTDLGPVPAAPDAPDGAVTVPNIPGFSGTAPKENLYGTISAPNMPADPGPVDTGVSFADITIPDFTSSVSISMPSPPTPINVDAPLKPTLDTIALPTAPNVTIPSLPTLETIDIPAFSFPTLPTFDAQAPTFNATAPDVTLNYSEIPYSSTSLDAVKTQVAAMMAGGTGIPPAVEDAIFARAVERADKRGNIEVQQAFNDYAGRGFDMPPGMLNAQVDAAREAQKERVAEARRDVFIKASEWEIENLRFAVQQGIAVESMLISVFNEAASRTLRVAELQQQGEIALYNAEVSVFNARQNAYQVKAQVFGEQLKAALSKLDVYRAQLEGQQIKSEINAQKVRTYLAQFEAVKAQIDVYSAQMKGAEVKSSVQKNKIEAYRAEVEAYGESIQAEKARYDAYRARIEGEGTKADIYATEARAFASTVEAQQGKVNLKAEEVRAKLGEAQANTQRYIAKVNAQRDLVSSESAAMQAQAQAYQAEVDRYAAEERAYSGTNQLKQTVIQNKVRNNIAFYEAQLREYDAIISRQIQQAQLNISAVTSAGEMTSQLAAGAMSAVSVGANVSGSWSESDSVSYSESHYYDETPLA